MDPIDLTPPLTPIPMEDQKYPEYSPEAATEIIATYLHLTEEEKTLVLEELNKTARDPILVIKQRSAWIAPPNFNAEDVLTAIAQWEMPQNQHRDECPDIRNFMFHFDHSREITRCRASILQNFGACFDHSPESLASLRAQGFVPPANNIFADTAIVHKIAVKKNDAQPYPFFFL